MELVSWIRCIQCAGASGCDGSALDCRFLFLRCLTFVLTFFHHIGVAGSTHRIETEFHGKNASKSSNKVFWLTDPQFSWHLLPQLLTPVLPQTEPKLAPSPTPSPLAVFSVDSIASLVALKSLCQNGTGTLSEAATEEASNSRCACSNGNVSGCTSKALHKKQTDVLLFRLLLPFGLIQIFCYSGKTEIYTGLPRVSARVLPCRRCSTIFM